MDSARLAGVNEALVVMLMARKFNKPICMHAGGVGLCEMVIHLAIFDYIGISGSLKDRWCEHCDALHEHFKDPVEIKNGCYVTPSGLGYASDMKELSIREYTYPYGKFWSNELQLQKLTQKNKFNLKNFTPFTGLMVATLTPYTVKYKHISIINFSG